MSTKKASIKSSTVFPEEKASISINTSDTIGSILESYNERGQRFAAEGIDYNPITLLTTISNLYLIKKYNTDCFMYGDRANDESFIYGGFVLNLASGQLNLPIGQISTNANILSQINGKNLFQMKNFLNCIKNNQPVIIIPLLLEFGSSEHHANLLIYRRDLNTIEHFEPLGPFFDLRKDYGDKITLIIQLIIDKINEINSTPKSKFFNALPANIILTPSNEVCIHSRGLQVIQSQLASFRIEGAGYCQMWSLLFAEMALLNPTMNSKDILDEIYKLLSTKDGTTFLSNVIRGYVSMLGDEISLYLSEYINNVFTIENISYTLNLLPDYGRYLSDILAFIVYIEVNIDTLFTSMPKTVSQLDAVETSLQGVLSNYFRLQNELKELLINRKRNYSIRGKEKVDNEIRSKLTEELTEYITAKRANIKNYVQNKIFQKYLRNKQQMIMVTKASKKGGKKYKKRKSSKTKKYKRNKKYKTSMRSKF